MTKTKTLWYGYVHTNGELLIKRYFSEEDLQEADASPFVVDRTDKIEAETRGEADKIARQILNIAEPEHEPFCKCSDCEQARATSESDDYDRRTHPHQ